MFCTGAFEGPFSPETRQNADKRPERCRKTFNQIHHARCVHSASKRARSKNDFCVPIPVVDRAAYRFARRKASFSGTPSPRKTAKLPMNASPAPVLSMLWTGKGGI